MPCHQRQVRTMLSKAKGREARLQGPATSAGFQVGHPGAPRVPLKVHPAPPTSGAFCSQHTRHSSVSQTRRLLKASYRLSSSQGLAPASFPFRRCRGRPLQSQLQLLAESAPASPAAGLRVQAAPPRLRLPPTDRTAPSLRGGSGSQRRLRRTVPAAARAAAGLAGARRAPTPLASPAPEPECVRRTGRCARATAGTVPRLAESWEL